ncbi:MAG: hypothetical protein IT193_09385 [Propionibacteriaceae bacterium]|nr:hypothetical protein [Propionibacteriaceae bacterium]
MSNIALTLPASTVTTADGRATLTASVTNSAPVPARIVLGAFGPAGQAGPGSATGGPAWTTIDRPLREIAAGATEQYTITFAPPAEAGAGNYPVRFIAYSADQAPEEHADQARQVDVVVPAKPVIPVKPKFVWWPWAVAAALVLVAGVVAFIILRPSGPVTPTPPPTPTSPPITVMNPCAEPWVPRLTRAEDITCVTAASAAEVVFDNNPAVQAERKAGGGAYGPNTCKPGWVWRDAYPGDEICVTVATRTRTAAENQPGYTKTPPGMPTEVYPTLYNPPTWEVPNYTLYPQQKYTLIPQKT